MAYNLSNQPKYTIRSMQFYLTHKYHKFTSIQVTFQVGRPMSAGFGDSSNRMMLREFPYFSISKSEDQ